MTGWVVRQFKGIAPRYAPQLLNENQGQAAVNTWMKRGSLVPIKNNSAVMTLPKAGTIQTIHRFGQSVASDSQYWFHWASDINVVRGAVADDAQERTYWTGEAQPRVTDNSIALTAGTQYPMNYYVLGVPPPASAPTGVVSGSGESGAIAETRVYVVTLVTGWGEEGSPSPVSPEYDVIPGQTVTLTLPGVVAGQYNLTGKRIYRSAGGGNYLFVAEVAAATGAYADTKTADQLGEVIPSLDYDMPPADLKGLVQGPNGVMGGFKGRDAYFCEPFKPYAWPAKYIQTVDADIVAIASFDTSWLILTKSYPYIVSGSDPSNYVMTRSDLAQACVSKRSVATVSGGCVYASPDGLYLVGGSGSRNLTENFLTRTEWQAMNPSTLHGYIIDNTYVGFHSGTSGLMMDLQAGDITTLDWYANAGYYDPIRDDLFLVTGTNALVTFNTSTARTQTWRSKAYYTPTPVTLGAGRVEAVAYPVTFKVYADGVLKHTETVANDDIFRLPSGFTAKVWEFELSSATEITSAGFAETPQDLQNG